ncbi:MAG: hypothetical protein Q4A67_01070 [Aerococcus sp.]|nr:hypothetical protein [Aerococcus sp.]
MTIKKGILGLLYLIELGMVLIMTQTQHFYNNHLNFMRSVLYRSHQIEAHHVWLIYLLAVLVLIGGIVFIWKQRHNPHAWLAGVVSVSYGVMTWAFSRATWPSYYVLLGELLVIVLLQFVQVALSWQRQ